MARPRLPINWDLVKRKMEAGCKACEIIEDLECDKGTFYDRFIDEFGESFSTYSHKFHSIGKGNIRLTQYEKALEGNTQMLSLLGEEWLGQRKQEQTNQNLTIQVIQYDKDCDNDSI